MSVRQRPFANVSVRQRPFANVSVRQRPVRQRVISPTCQFANDQFANVSVRQRPFANGSVRQRLVLQLVSSPMTIRQRISSLTTIFQRVSSPTTSSPTCHFVNVSVRQRSVRQRSVRQRVVSPTTSSPTTIRQHVSSPTTSSPTCQFAKIINYKNIILVIITFKLTFTAQEKYAKIAKKVFRFNIIFQWEETVQVCDLAGVLLRLYCPQSSVSSIAKLPEFAPFRTIRFRSGFRLCSCAFSTVSRQGNQRKARQNALRNSLFRK